MNDEDQLFEQDIQEKPLRDMMETSFLEYAMSVIVGRSIPDARDGMKPVHRRILFAMKDAGFTPDKSTVKCAKIVGNVIGNFHPHGERAVYDALVRMAQDFNMRYPLVTPQGNFGSIDGDPPAAYRYTEAKLNDLGEFLLEDIDKETVEFEQTFDGENQEPLVLPAGVPALLMNGTEGIAVGMATSIPPHNLGELAEGIKLLINNPDAGVDELMDCIPAPDFPGGGIIMGDEGIREAYETGRGTLYLRSRIDQEMDERDRVQLVVKELPFQVNKSSLIEKIVRRSKEDKIEGISDVRDESDRTGIRVVIELKRSANPSVVQNQLLNHTRLQVSYHMLMLALVDEVPQVCSLKELLEVFIEHRREVITRRTEYLLQQAEDRAHILRGLRKALDHIDRVIEIIRGSEDTSEARESLIGEFDFTEVQAKKILNMPLKRLTSLEEQKILDELEELEEDIEYYESLLADPEKIDGVLVDELEEAVEEFGDERRSLVVEDADPFGEFDKDALIKPEDIVVTMTKNGYIKRVPLSTYRSQRRGGRGLKGQNLREEDVLEHIAACNTHDLVLFFTDRGQVYSDKAYHIPAYQRNARGLPVVNLLQMRSEEEVTTILPVSDDNPYEYLFFVTKYGTVKRTEAEEFTNLRSTGKRAINLDEEIDDRLNFIMPTTGNEDIMLISRQGQACWFDEDNVRPMGNTAQGVIGMRLEEEDDFIVGADTVTEDDTILVVGENGYGKRTDADEFRRSNRAVKGVIAMNVTDKTGPVIAGYRAEDDDELLIVTKNGLVIRQEVGEIPRYNRNTQGVKLIDLKEGDKVSSVDIVRAETETQEDKQQTLEDES